MRPHFSRKLTAELFLLTTTIFWGSTFVVVKWGLADFPPLTLLALRFSLAAVLFLILFPKTWLHTDWSAIWAGGFLGLFLFLGFALQTVGLVYTTASKSAFITGLLVIFTPFVQVILERRSPTRGNLIGVGIVSLGLWFLTAPEGGSWNRGDSLTLLCAIVFSIYIVYLDIMSKKCEVLPLTMIQITAVAALSWAGVWAFENPLWRPGARAVWIVVYLAVGATMITTYLQTRYQKDTTPTRAAIIFTVEPVWAALFAAIALNEHLGPVGVLGGGLIIAGVLVSELSDGKSARTDPKH